MEYTKKIAIDRILTLNDFNEIELILEKYDTGVIYPTYMIRIICEKKLIYLKVDNNFDLFLSNFLNQKINIQPSNTLDDLNLNSENQIINIDYDENGYIYDEYDVKIYQNIIDFSQIINNKIKLMIDENNFN